MKFYNYKISFDPIKKKGHVFSLLVAWSLFFSCTYDDEETLILSNPCDTVPVTYSGVIQPILETYCYSCHSSNNPSGGIILDNYEDVRDIALEEDSRLIGSINHEAGYAAMPQRQSKLDSCKLHYFDVWVEQGGANN